MSGPHVISADATHEKSRAAFSSLLAALLLTSLKLVVGFSTNSLGILSEAAHSGLDLLAAGVTFYAVRASAQPADERHPYGHGKIENLSALVETVLLLVTCGWIVWEAVTRLVFNPEHVTPSVWGFAVMGISIAIDISRSRMLKRMAIKHNSQALEADALHFATDIWSSAVVIVGLVALQIATLLPPGLARNLLEKADAVAALGVSAIVVHVSIALGRKAIDALLDGGSQEHASRISRDVEALDGVCGVRRIRVRESGPHSFVDLTICVRNNITIDDAHHIAHEAESAVHTILPQADVTVHVEPEDTEGKGGVEATVRRLAATHTLPVHGLDIITVSGQTHIELHAELDAAMPLAVAHEKVNQFESALRKALGPAHIVTHIEPGGDPRRAGEAKRPRTVDMAQVQEVLDAIVNKDALACQCHHLHAYSHGGGLSLSFHCRMPATATVATAHEATERIEAELRQRIYGLLRVVIHTEPLQ